MLASGTDIMLVAGIIMGLFLALVALRLLSRLCGNHPLVGLVLSLCFLGWVHQNPDVIAELVPTQPEAVASLSTVDDVNSEELDSNISDEDLVEHYQRQNIHFAHEVSRAPGRARGMVGL